MRLGLPQRVTLGALVLGATVGAWILTHRAAPPSLPPRWVAVAGWNINVLVPGTGPSAYAPVQAVFFGVRAPALSVNHLQLNVARTGASVASLVWSPPKLWGPGVREYHASFALAVAHALHGPLELVLANGGWHARVSFAEANVGILRRPADLLHWLTGSAGTQGHYQASQVMNETFRYTGTRPATLVGIAQAGHYRLIEERVIPGVHQVTGQGQIPPAAQPLSGAHVTPGEVVTVFLHFAARHASARSLVFQPGLELRPVHGATVTETLPETVWITDYVPSPRQVAFQAPYHVFAGP